MSETNLKAIENGPLIEEIDHSTESEASPMFTGVSALIPRYKRMQDSENHAVTPKQHKAAPKPEM